MTRSLLPELGRRDGARSAMPVVLLSLAAMALWPAGSARAQYKVVEPGGRVTYTDRPPSYAAQTAPGSQANAGAGAAAASELAALSAGLPYVLRQAVQRYPVRLYATNACAPCDAARQYLQRRGVPLLEYSVNREEDGELLRREVGVSELPALMVGRQRLIGFSELDWQQTLEAAGYPATSQLPSAYRYPTVRPLADSDRRDGRSASPSPRTSAAPMPRGSPGLPDSPVSPISPGGFRF